MEYQNIHLEKNGPIAILTINRPPANAINVATLEEINAALDELERDTALRVVIFTGAGEKGFSSGFDVSDAGNADRASVLGQETWTRIDRFSKPTIAAINGFAFGGGCELALACHFRCMVSNPKALIGLTELNLGIIPGWGGTQRMTRILGRSKALDLIIFSRRLSAEEALAIGLIDKVVTPGALMEEALTLATQLAARPPIAVGCVLNAVAAYFDKGIDEGLRLERAGINRVKMSKDAQEGFMAFIEKRPAVFTGE